MVEMVTHKQKAKMRARNESPVPKGKQDKKHSYLTK